MSGRDTLSCGSPTMGLLKERNCELKYYEQDPVLSDCLSVSWARSSFRFCRKVAHISSRSAEMGEANLKLLKTSSFIKLMSNDYSVMRSWYAKNLQDFLSIEKLIHEIDENHHRKNAERSKLNLMSSLLLPQAPI